MKIIFQVILLIFSMVLYGQPSTDSLRAYYPFTGNANDASGRNHHGTVYSATPCPDRFGIPNRAYNFDGINDYIGIQHKNDLNFNAPEEFSLSLWVKPATTQLLVTNNAKNVIVSKWIDNGSNNDNYPYDLRIFNHNTPDEGKLSGLRFDKSCSGVNQVASTSTVNDLAWHHVAFVKRNDSLYLYLDCELQGKDKDLSLCSNVNFDSLFIGKKGGSWNPTFFTGAIDEIRIYARPLAVSEIDSLCNIYLEVEVLRPQSYPLSISPNPAFDILNIDFQGELPSECIAMDMCGRSTTLSVHSDRTIDISKLSRGLYYLHLVSTDHSNSIRFVKN